MRSLGTLGSGPEAQRKATTVLRLVGTVPAAKAFGQPDTATYRQWYGGRCSDGHYRRGWCSDARVRRALTAAQTAYKAAT